MLHPMPVLYQPTSAEIVKVTASAAHRHPAFAARIDKAAAILYGDLQLDQLAWDMRNVVRWHIASQSHGGAYVVCGLHCPCQDSRAPMINNVRTCKHSMAVSFYMKILRTHVNVDIRNREIDLGILHTGEFHAYAGCMGYVQLRKSGIAYDFSDATSAVRYSLWLAAQQPLPVAWPVAHSASVALAA
jgi:hypothetical protein